MKTLIIFSSKKGATADVAELIKGKFDNAVVWDIKNTDKPRLDEFDTIIIGSSVYVGKIHKDVKAFVSKNSEILRQKKLGLFLCGLLPKEAYKVFENGFAPVLQYAKAKVFAGGVYDPKKSGFASRLVMKAVAKLSEYTNTVDGNAIDEFAASFKDIC